MTGKKYFSFVLCEKISFGRINEIFDQILHMYMCLSNSYNRSISHSRNMPMFDRHNIVYSFWNYFEERLNSFRLKRSSKHILEELLQTWKLYADESLLWVLYDKIITNCDDIFEQTFINSDLHIMILQTQTADHLCDFEFLRYSIVHHDCQCDIISQCGTNHSK